MAGDWQPWLGTAGRWRAGCASPISADYDDGLYLIPADRAWVMLATDIVKGARYGLIARGEWQDGVAGAAADGQPCGPDGLDPGRETSIHRHLRRFLRAPGRPYLELLGCFDKRLETVFPIGGGHAEWTAPQSGRLYVFANDWGGVLIPWGYGNNDGVIALFISEPG